MILCHCAAVSEATVDRLIDQGATSIAEITSRSGAGRSCAPCRDEILARLYAARAPQHNRSAQAELTKQQAA